MPADTTSAAPSERKQFEAAMRTLFPGWSFLCDRMTGYENLSTSYAWKGWQAARRAQPTPPAVVEPLTYERIMAAWNAQADEYNQWDELGEDEKIEWAVKCAHCIKGDETP